MLKKMSTNISQYWARIACCIIRPSYGGAPRPGLGQKIWNVRYFFFAHIFLFLSP